MRTCIKPIQVLAMLSCLCVLSGALQTQGQTLTDNNSTVTINPLNQSGMNSWVVDGQAQLDQQWFWYALGPTGSSTPPASIDTLSLTQDSQASGPNQLALTYAGAGFNISVDYLLRGGAAHSYTSDMSESISIQNTSASPITMQFYKYADFDLQGVAGGQTVNITQNGRGMYNDAFQYSSLMVLTEGVATPGSTLAEAATENQTLGELNNGSLPVVLNDNANAGPGAVTSAFQWNLTIAAGGTALISTDDYIQTQAEAQVPEPSIFALIPAGGLALFSLRRRFQRA